jgi:short-subunit dehydrogenase
VNIGGRTALVTGATGGLGEAIARALADRGASLVLTGRRVDVLEPLAAELGARSVIADLADRTALAAVLEESGNADIVVANAALPADGPIVEYAEEQIDRALDVNLRVPILMAKVAAESMPRRGEGHVVFISSISGKLATHGSALYSATKFGLRGFASALRQDLHGAGVGVSCIFPGPIREAGMFAQTEVELPRLAATRSPQDVANAVVRAIERNRAEIDVAAPPVRWSAALAGVAPGLVAGVSRRLGAEDYAAQIARSEAHRSRR